MSWGITLADFEQLTIGMIVDLIIEFSDEYERANGNDARGSKQSVRKATQADFDRF